MTMLQDRNTTLNHPAFGLHSFPVEILDEVAGYFHNKGSTLNLQRTCSTLHWVVSRKIYRNVEVSELPARKFMKTLVETNCEYGNYTRSLVYRATSNADTYLTYPLLGEAIHHLTRLQSLTLLIPPDLTSYLCDLLRASSIIYPIFYCRLDEVAPCDLVITPCPRMPCPTLVALNIYGNIQLVDFAIYRSLASLSISNPMTEDDINHFLHATTNFTETGTNGTLVELSLTLSFFLGGVIAKTLWTIGFSFSALANISIRAPSINALEASATLTLVPTIFPNLRSFSLNEGSILDAYYACTQTQALDLQRQHLVTAGNLRGQFAKATFGTNAWTKDNKGDNWDVANITNVSGIPNPFNDEFIGFYVPLFWDTYYVEPQPFMHNGVDMFASERSRISNS